MAHGGGSWEQPAQEGHQGWTLPGRLAWVWNSGQGDGGRGLRGHMRRGRLLAWALGFLGCLCLEIHFWCSSDGLTRLSPVCLHVRSQPGPGSVSADAPVSCRVRAPGVRGGGLALALPWGLQALLLCSRVTDTSFWFSSVTWGCTQGLNSFKLPQRPGWEEWVQAGTQARAQSLIPLGGGLCCRCGADPLKLQRSWASLWAWCGPPTVPPSLVTPIPPPQVTVVVAQTGIANLQVTALLGQGLR